jgi:hypothetical protein
MVITVAALRELVEVQQQLHIQVAVEQIFALVDKPTMREL